MSSGLTTRDMALGAGAVAALTGFLLDGAELPQTATPAMSTAQAARFLTQATFGVTDADIQNLQTLGYAGWIRQQLTLPAAISALAFMQSEQAKMIAFDPKARAWLPQLNGAIYQQAAQQTDLAGGVISAQLRARMALAWSEIFVISVQNSKISNNAETLGFYWDTLFTNAFANFRGLLEAVTLSPAMGAFLTYDGNRKGDPALGTHADQNYAREVMQLMTIGIWQLNPDGSQTLSSGAPIPTYGGADIAGLADVFTGIQWAHPPTAGAITPMIYNDAIHATDAKSFLGVTIPASSTPDTAGDVKIALDTLFNHPNVGPFIGARLIQHFVTSNPSAAYVRRVAAVFADNGAGVRGDMGAVIAAILLDADARSAPNGAALSYGKLREPVVRLANWMRSFDAGSQTGVWGVSSTEANTALNQNPFASPTVFNFFSPGYAPPNLGGSKGMVAPEFQIVDQVSVAGYLNTLQIAIYRGIGGKPIYQTTPITGGDVVSAYAKEIPLATNPFGLVARLNTLLFSGAMSASLQQSLISAIDSIAIPGGGATGAQIAQAKLLRVQMAVFLAMASNDYLVQR
jgi:uncharacterized protein (DUF1800 family)